MITEPNPMAAAHASPSGPGHPLAPEEAGLDHQRAAVGRRVGGADGLPPRQVRPGDGVDPEGEEPQPRERRERDVPRDERLDDPARLRFAEAVPRDHRHPHHDERGP
jgi:hypothetical protein